MRVPLYLKRIAHGFLNPRPELRWESTRPAVAILDADDTLGHVAAVRAMQRAVELAKEHGIGCVGVRNSSHFGPAAHHASMAVEAGCIGISMTNGPPVMAPAGGREARLCNNPLAVAIPGGEHPPVVLDIAMSVAAGGKIHLARQEHRTIPEGWALSADGKPTTDPEKAVAGPLLPMGGHKGYGLAFVIEVLAGVLTGSHFAMDVRPQWDTNHAGLEAGTSHLGHLCIAIDVAAMASPDSFTARLRALVEQMHSCPPVDGVERVLTPGELEQRTTAQRSREGIPLSPAVLDALLAGAGGVGVSVATEHADAA
jgi:LDH2 family malate/lactate/ureidoglycolate dehydrogenase